MGAENFNDIKNQEIKTIATTMDASKDTIIQKNEVEKSNDKIKALADKVGTHLDDIKKIDGLYTALAWSIKDTPNIPENVPKIESAFKLWDKMNGGKYTAVASPEQMKTIVSLSTLSWLPNWLLLNKPIVDDKWTITMEVVLSKDKIVLQPNSTTKTLEVASSSQKISYTDSANKTQFMTVSYDATKWLVVSPEKSILSQVVLPANIVNYYGIDKNQITISPLQKTIDGYESKISVQLKSNKDNNYTLQFDAEWKIKPDQKITFKTKDNNYITFTTTSGWKSGELFFDEAKNIKTEKSDLKKTAIEKKEDTQIVEPSMLKTPIDNVLYRDNKLLVTEGNIVGHEIDLTNKPECVVLNNTIYTITYDATGKKNIAPYKDSNTLADITKKLAEGGANKNKDLLERIVWSTMLTWVISTPKEGKNNSAGNLADIISPSLQLSLSGKKFTIPLDDLKTWKDIVLPNKSIFTLKADAVKWLIATPKSLTEYMKNISTTVEGMDGVSITKQADGWHKIGAQTVYLNDAWAMFSDKEKTKSLTEVSVQNTADNQYYKVKYDLDKNAFVKNTVDQAKNTEVAATQIDAKIAKMMKHLPAWWYIKKEYNSVSGKNDKDSNNVIVKGATEINIKNSLKNGKLEWIQTWDGYLYSVWEEIISLTGIQHLAYDQTPGENKILKEDGSFTSEMKLVKEDRQVADIDKPKFEELNTKIATTNVEIKKFEGLVGEKNIDANLKNNRQTTLDGHKKELQTLEQELNAKYPKKVEKQTITIDKDGNITAPVLQSHPKKFGLKGVQTDKGFVTLNSKSGVWKTYDEDGKEKVAQSTNDSAETKSETNASWSSMVVETAKINRDTVDKNKGKKDIAIEAFKTHFTFADKANPALEFNEQTWIWTISNVTPRNPTTGKIDNYAGWKHDQKVSYNTKTGEFTAPTGYQLKELNNKLILVEDKEKKRGDTSEKNNQSSNAEITKKLNYIAINSMFWLIIKNKNKFIYDSDKQLYEKSITITDERGTKTDLIITYNSNTREYWSNNKDYFVDFDDWKINISRVQELEEVAVKISKKKVSW